jgi:16S rRNA processing protein RimM
MSERRVTLAAITGAHGVTGEVRLKLFAASLDSFRRFRAFEAAGRTLTLNGARVSGAQVIARFAELSDRNAAEALRGTELSVPRDALPPLAAGEHYAHDLVGMAVLTTSGAAVGTVAAVENYGAGDILDIEKPDGSRFMVPFNTDAVPEVGDCIRLDPAFLP